MQRGFLVVALFALSAIRVAAQPAGSGDDAAAKAALAKAVLNPVASLISVPIQNNDNFSSGPFGRVRDFVSVQPVIPFKVGSNWNLIIRTIIPLLADQPNPASPTDWAGGLGDLNPTFFLSPQRPGKLIWGVGPALVLPTATNELLGQGKWSAGPSVVWLVQPGKWTVGSLANNVWSYAGDKNRAAVNQFLMQDARPGCAALPEELAARGALWQDAQDGHT